MVNGHQNGSSLLYHLATARQYGNQLTDHLTMSATPTTPLRTKANTLVSGLVQSIHCEKNLVNLTTVSDLVYQEVNSNNADKQFNIQQVNQSLQKDALRLLLYL